MLLLFIYLSFIPDKNECSIRNGGCDHRCINTIGKFSNMFSKKKMNDFQCLIGSFKCECHDGYQIGKDGRTCIDKNECLDKSICQNYCINTPGSYKCSCKLGFELRNNHECIGRVFIFF